MTLTLRTLLRPRTVDDLFKAMAVTEYYTTQARTFQPFFVFTRDEKRGEGVSQYELRVQTLDYTDIRNECRQKDRFGLTSLIQLCTNPSSHMWS